MKVTYTICDICKDKKDTKVRTVPAVFTTNLSDGRSCNPFIRIAMYDVCDECYERIVKAIKIRGVGAQNNYEFIIEEQ